MRKRTSLGVALLGASMMFFLGFHSHVILGMLGLSRLRPGAKGGAASGGAAVVAAAAASAERGRMTKNEAAAELLHSVLTDDDRKLCSVRYPKGLTVTLEQREYLNDLRFFLVITLRNNEELLHHTLYELLNVIAHLGPRHVFVSVFENNSRDKTPQFLALFTDLLKLAGVAHNLVSTFTLQRELAAIRAAQAEAEAAAKAGAGAALAAGAGRRLLDDAQAAQLQASGQPAWLEAAVEEQLLAQASGAAGLASGTEWWPRDAEEEEGGADTVEDAPPQAAAGAVDGSAAGGAAPAANATGARRRRLLGDAPAGVSDAQWAQLQAQAASIGAAWRAEAAALREQGRSQGGGAAAGEPVAADGIAAGAAGPGRPRNATAGAPALLRTPLAAGTRGRVLADVATDAASDLAILTEGKWTGNRIEFLARVRNRSIRPLVARRERYEKVIIMNDAYFCAEDVLRLALHRDADVACGLDFDTTGAYGVGFYDTWVTRDVRGEPFKKRAPFIQRSEEADRLRFGKPFPVFCCWNGVLVANSAPFYEGVRFRRGVPGECAASECSLFCKDFWRKRARNFVLDPHVRVAYDTPTYEALHRVDWMETSSPHAAPAHRVDWPEDIPWPARPPERVFCCGLDGNGRDPDQPCFHEEQHLEL